LSATHINPALWQKVAVDTPVTFCNSSFLKPHHVSGNFFLFAKLPSSFGIALIVYPFRFDLKTAYNIFCALGLVDSNTNS